MESKPVLHNSKNLEILIDSKNLGIRFYDDPNVKRIIDYSQNNHFNFLRTPYNTLINEIDLIPHFDNDLDYERGLGGIDILKEGSVISSQAVTPVLANVEIIGKEVLHKDSLSLTEWEKIWYVFVHHSIADHGRIFDKKTSIYITEDEDILKNRNWFSKHFPGDPIHIASITEGMEIMDLFAKNQDSYQITPHGTANRGYWYWLYFRTLVPHYHVPVPSNVHPLNTLSSRFVFLLQSLDEMGINFFKKVNNDTGDLIQYHFNYFIALMTGIFDSLARTVKLHYSIDLDQTRGQSSISLSNNAGRYFLNKIRDHNTSLREHLSQNMTFINLIYEIRENVLHRDFQRPVTFGSMRSNDANLLRIPTSITTHLQQLNDHPKKYDDYTVWGMYNDAQIGYFLSPYDFAKRASIELIKFVEGFLEKLDYSLFVKPDSSGDFMNSLVNVRTKSLGVLLNNET